jgi:hypothetical protein
VLELSNDQDHADGNVERHGIDASEEAIGDDSNVIRLKCSTGATWCSTSHYSPVACQGIGAVNVHNADGDVLMILLQSISIVLNIYTYIYYGPSMQVQSYAQRTLLLQDVHIT